MELLSREGKNILKYLLIILESIVIIRRHIFKIDSDWLNRGLTVGFLVVCIIIIVRGKNGRKK